MSMNPSSPRGLLPTPICARVAPVLPLLDSAPSDQETVDAWVREHVNTCAYCQAQQGQYRSIDWALRERYGLAAIRPRRTEEIMQHITDRATASGHTASRRRLPSRRPFLSTLGAVASVAALLALAAALFAGRLGGGARGYSGPPNYTFPGVQGLLGDISMVSNSEGWALAQVTKTPQGSHSLNEVTFYHYKNGTWTPVSVSTSQSLGTGGVSGFNGTISMDSATDGWAVAHNFNQVSVLLHYANGAWAEAPSDGLYLVTVQALSPTSVWAITGPSSYTQGQQNQIVHFDGTTWTPQPITGLPPESAPSVADLHMVSDHEGWALAYLGPSGSNYAILHYQGGSWTVHSTLAPGQFADLGALDMLSPTEGWALGQKVVADASGNTTHVPLKQLLYHYTNGKWSDASPSLPGGWVNLERIEMLSPSDGWIIGSEQNAYPGATVSNFEQHPVVLHYSGGQWRQVSVQQTGTAVDVISGLAFRPDGSGWAAGYVSAIPATQTVQDTDVLAQASPELWTYQNGAWTIYHP